MSNWLLDEWNKVEDAQRRLDNYAKRGAIVAPILLAIIILILLAQTALDVWGG